MAGFGGGILVSQSSTLPDFIKLWNYNDPAATEKKFRDLIEPAKHSGDASYYLELLTQVARAQGLQDKFTDAHATLDEVQMQLRDDLKTARVRYLLERGRVFTSSNQPEKAKPLFLQAWELASAANETKYAADALHMVAIIEPLPADKIKWNEKALQYIEAHPEERRWLDAVYNNLGEACLLMKDYQSALACFQRVVELDKERGREPWIYSLKDISKCQRLLGRTNEAMAVIQPVYDDLKKKQESDGWISGELAECLLAQGKKADAKALFKEAYAAFQEDDYLIKHESEHVNLIKKQAEED